MGFTGWVCVFFFFSSDSRATCHTCDDEEYLFFCHLRAERKIGTRLSSAQWFSIKGEIRGFGTTDVVERGCMVSCLEPRSGEEKRGVFRAISERPGLGAWRQKIKIK